MRRSDQGTYHVTVHVPRHASDTGGKSRPITLSKSSRDVSEAYDIFRALNSAKTVDVHAHFTMSVPLSRGASSPESWEREVNEG